MAKLKITNRYGIVPNQLLNDPSISWKAKWLFGYLQSKPEDRDFAIDRIRKDSADGRDSTTNWIKELEKAWYLQRTKKWLEFLGDVVILKQKSFGRVKRLPV